MRKLTPSLLGIWLAFGLGVPLHAQAPKPRPKEPVRERRPEAPRTAPAVIETDLACSLVLDGEEVGQLAANETRTFQLGLGEHVLRATSRDYPDIIWRKTIEVVSGQRRAMVIELKPLVDQYKAEEARRRESEDERRSSEAARRSDEDRRRAADASARALAEQVERVRGLWTDSNEYDGRFTDTNEPYKAKATTSVTIAGERSPLTAKLVERTVFTTPPGPSGVPGGFTKEILATFSLQVSETGVTGQLVSLQQRNDSAPFADEPAAMLRHFSFIRPLSGARDPTTLSISVDIAKGTTRDYRLTKR